MQAVQNFFTLDLVEAVNLFKEENSKLNLKVALEKVKEIYQLMLELRKFEERAGDLYSKGDIAGFCHLYSGQEAVAAGVTAAAEDGDAYITTYRDHGLMLACGGDPVKVMAELTGREIGYSKGKGGSMHIFDLEKKFYGGHGIVGASTALGTGIAFEMKYNNKPNVCYTFLGDGASNQGQFYESMNIASLWNLPVIYIIENNGYAMGTSIDRSTYDINFFNRGLPFGIFGIQVDGMDFFDVYKKMKIARDYCITQKRPVLIEMKTYRYRGHSMSDPAKYREKVEVEAYKEKDPINKLAKFLIESGAYTENDCSAIEDKVSDRMREVAKLAVAAKEPDASELYTDVYSIS